MRFVVDPHRGTSVSNPSPFRQHVHHRTHASLPARTSQADGPIRRARHLLTQCPPVPNLTGRLRQSPPTIKNQKTTERDGPPEGIGGAAIFEGRARGSFLLLEEVPNTARNDAVSSRAYFVDDDRRIRTARNAT